MPIDRPQPPLATLRIFEAAARRQSFLLAAAELGLTPGAVSKQVKQLELFLGRPLFDRHHREVRLTPAGEGYFRAVAQVFGDLRAATLAAMAGAERDELVLWCAPWFLKAWLLPRLDGFSAQRPDMQLDILTGESSEAIPPRAELAIRLGAGRWPGMRTDPLTPQQITAVCTPAYLHREGLAPPYNFAAFTVLDSANTPEHLDQWKAAAGFAAVAPRGRIVFQSNETAFAAALNDHGLALVNPRFVAVELAQGALVQPWPTVIRTAKDYCVTWREGVSLRPAAAAFRKWLLAELRRG